MSKFPIETKYIATWRRDGWRCDSCGKQVGETPENQQSTSEVMPAPVAWPDKWCTLIVGEVSAYREAPSGSTTGPLAQSLGDVKHICDACVTKLLGGELKPKAEAST